MGSAAEMEGTGKESVTLKPHQQKLFTLNNKVQGKKKMNKTSWTSRPISKGLTSGTEDPEVEE